MTNRAQIGPIPPQGQPQGLSEQDVLMRRAAGEGNNARLETSRSYRQILQEKHGGITMIQLINNLLEILKEIVVKNIKF
jgi:hypothetical protein